jgi:hypothetical protein
VAALVSRRALVPVTICAGHGSSSSSSGGGASLLLPREDLAALTTPPPAPGAWPLRLLGRYDPLLLGHKDKGVWVDRAHYSRVWSNNATIEATVLLHGRIVGIWGAERVGSGGLLLRVTPFDAGAVRGALPALRRQAAGIARFWSRELTDVVAVA